MQLDDVDIFGPEPALLVDLLRRRLRQVIADHLDTTLLLEAALEVGRHRHPENLDGPGLETMLLDEILARDDRRARAVRGGTALELGERLVDHRRAQDILQ